MIELRRRIRSYYVRLRRSEMDAELAKDINTKTDTESDKQKRRGLAKSSKHINRTQKSKNSTFQTSAHNHARKQLETHAQK